VTTDDNLLTVADRLSLVANHCVPVVDHRTREMVGIISQSAFLSYIYDRRAEYEPALLGNVCGLGTSPVTSVSASASLLEALKILEKRRVSAIGIVSDRGDLIALASSTDIKAVINKGHIGSFQTPVLDFVRSLHANSIDIRAPLICVSKHASLQEAIGRMVKARVHRVFVVDEQDRPYEVLSITDIVRHFGGKARTAH
jgi:5'-AMP-activated protein kinase regulatory gamma subunit